MAHSALNLRDIHLPEPITWWPPALGWWLLAIGLPISLYFFYRLYRHLTRQTPVKTALRLLSGLADNTMLTPQEKAAELSMLMRRVVMSSSSHNNEVAGLTGDAWLNFLNQNLPDAPFSQATGALLSDAPYRPQNISAQQLTALVALCRRWMLQCAKSKSPVNRL
jgi:hypothetical protein